MVAIFAIRLSPFLFSNPPKYTLFAPSPRKSCIICYFQILSGRTAKPQEHMKTTTFGEGGGATANIVYYEGFHNRQLRNAWKSRVISDLKQTRFLTEKKFLRCWAVALQYKFFTLTSSYKLRSKTPCLSSLISLGQGKIHKQVKDFKYSRRMTHCLYTEA